jgi:ATP-dependent DNA helicase RecQ
MKGKANSALTVVISPLQALMKDQVDVLKSRFDITSAVAINGLLSPLERADAIEKVREGGVDLLYISPESLRSNTILNLLKGRQIERFVIDEAHCFSSWGQDFRVDYLYIGKFIRQLGLMKNLPKPIPVSCFTATAKPEVIKDIQQYFFEQNGLHLKLFQTTATRTNLSYYASKADSRESKLNQLLKLLSQTDEPCIVYVSRTKTTEDVAEALRKSGITAQAFHGQMESEDKIRIQEGFMKGETQVIVATSAFGMGVDKDNVKMVVHYDISDSLENYLQEAGRAGRKADLEADCHLLFDENDLNEHFALLNQTKLSQKEVAQIWRGIKAFKRSKFTRSALEIAKQSGWDKAERKLDKQETVIDKLKEQKTELEKNVAFKDKEFELALQEKEGEHKNSLNGIVGSLKEPETLEALAGLFNAVKEMRSPQAIELNSSQLPEGIEAEDLQNEYIYNVVLFMARSSDQVKQKIFEIINKAVNKQQSAAA